MTNDERTFENAPEVFRARLERLRQRGLLNDLAFREAFIRAAAKVRQETADELAATQDGKKGVRKSPPKSEREDCQFPNKAIPGK